MALGRTYDRLDSPTATMVCLLVLHLGVLVRGGAGAIQILAHVGKFDRSKIYLPHKFPFFLRYLKVICESKNRRIHV